MEHPATLILRYFTHACFCNFPVAAKLNMLIQVLSKMATWYLTSPMVPLDKLMDSLEMISCPDVIAFLADRLKLCALIGLLYFDCIVPSVLPTGLCTLCYSHSI